MFTASQAHEHARRKRAMVHVYSRRSVQTSPHVRAILRTVLLGNLLPVFARASETALGIVDVLPLLQALALDFASCFVFGLSEGLRLIQDPSARRYWLGLFVRLLPAKSMNRLLEFPWITQALCRLGVPLVPAGCFEARRESEAWTTDKVRRAERRLKEARARGSQFPPGELPVLYCAVKDGIARDVGAGDEFVPDHGQELALASECFNHVRGLPLVDVSLLRVTCAREADG